MSDIIERLRQPVMLHSNPEQTNAERREAADQIERLRAKIGKAPCPGGGWNGMPEDMEPTIENCMAHDACGCVYGDILRNG